MNTALTRERRKPGRPKTGNNVEKYTVMLPPWLHEWAMNHAEGLSGLVRRLLQEEEGRGKKRGVQSSRA
jgi:hypothetical protein